MEEKKMIYYLSGDRHNINLLKQKIDTFPKDEFGMTELSNIVLYVLNTPISSMFCEGKCKILDVIDLSSSRQTFNQIRFEIEFNDNIPIKSFDKLVDELFIRYELERLN